MSILDIEDKYPDIDFWLKQGYIRLKHQRMWANLHTKHLHWNISSTETRWGTVRIYAEYNECSKILRIIQHRSSFYYGEVDFEPIIIIKPTQADVEMALSKEFLSSRLTYKHK